MQQHGDALDAHTEGKTTYFLGVVAHGLEHVRMHHARAQDLEPTGVLADPTAAAAAKHARDVDLGARLDEREEARPQANLRLAAEQPLGKGAQDALQVGHRYALGPPTGPPPGGTWACG